ncbi:hypothetical protein FDG2_1888 [Candidatus Protofrankia californiensis]|uniref:DUF2637 domain-containing protein n=1 Tax=Candidatus Protofrankia californiensis TaxID=1839754 RepID=A0A1C3NWL8_9ACTN|nr:hypothetical protein FDG2_1888 [Candidatus Protofrankia californiensis]
MRAGAGPWERGAYTVLPAVLGAGVFAVAFVHVHDVARWAGQPEWASWLIACTGELMAIAAGAAILACRRSGASIGWPVFVLVAAILFSGACNLRAAGQGALDSPPGIWVQIMAVWPVIAFGLVAILKATKPSEPDAHTQAEIEAQRESRPAVAVPAVASVVPSDTFEAPQWGRGWTPSQDVVSAVVPPAGGTVPTTGGTPVSLIKGAVREPVREPASLVRTTSREPVPAVVPVPVHPAGGNRPRTGSGNQPDGGSRTTTRAGTGTTARPSRTGAVTGSRTGTADLAAAVERMERDAVATTGQGVSYRAIRERYGVRHETAKTLLDAARACIAAAVPAGADEAAAPADPAPAVPAPAAPAAALEAVTA